MSAPNRRLRLDKSKNLKRSTAPGGRKIEPLSSNAASWRVLEGKKGRGAEKHVDEVGELKIPALPQRVRGQVLAVIDHVAQEAERRDSKHRILRREKIGSGVRIVTSENQLAVRIGKKLDSAFKGGQLKISYSDEDRLIRVVWQTPSK